MFNWIQRADLEAETIITKGSVGGLVGWCQEQDKIVEAEANMERLGRTMTR